MLYNSQDQRPHHASVDTHGQYHSLDYGANPISPNRGRLPVIPAVSFEKMHSLHNHILVLYDLNPEQWDGDSDQWRQHMRLLCCPWQGLGAHQVMALFIQPHGDFNNHPQGDILVKDLVLKPPLLMRIWNSDGSEAGACGNGTRCVFYGLWHRNAPAVSWRDGVASLPTAAGPVHGMWQDDNTVAVRQGTCVVGRIRVPSSDVLLETVPPPLLTPSVSPRWHEQATIDVTLPDGDKRVAWTADMGNPHAVIVGPPPRDLSPAWQLAHPSFPLGANVSFVWWSVSQNESMTSLKPALPITVTSAQCPQRSYPDQGHWRVATWERGVGLTPACASGSCATAAVLHAISSAPEGLEQGIVKQTAIFMDFPWVPHKHARVWQPPYHFSLPGGDIMVDLQEGEWTHAARVVPVARGLLSWPEF